MLGISADERERRRRRWEAKRAAQICGACGGNLKPDDPVWRTYFGLGSHSWCIIPICTACNSDRRGYDGGRPCQTCGRLVHDTWGGRHRRHAFCSVLCSQSALQPLGQGAPRQGKAQGLLHLRQILHGDQERRDHL